MDDRPTEIDEYRVLGTLGRGGMGEVYLAEDRALDRRVAIKVIAGVADHPDVRARFAVEARAIGRLKHPNVVTVHRTGEFDGRPYLVSEYVEGTPLDQLAHPIGRDRALAIGIQLARGLEAAHAEGILHRDIKPANAIIDAHDVVKLLDFGLAKLADPDAETRGPGDPEVPPTSPPATLPSTDRDAATVTFTPSEPAVVGTALELTAAGSQLGTPRYMAPEAWHGHRLTAASDVYSLGLVLWELLAGRHPFAGDDGATQATRVCAGDVPGLHAALPTLSPAIVRVVERCLRRVPAERYVDAGALRVELELAAAPPVARRPRRWAMSLGLVAIGGLGAFAIARQAGGAGDEPATTPAAPSARAPAKPRALTSIGGCADNPAFIDAATIAFTILKDDDVDVATTTGDGTYTTVAASKGWDFRATAGRLPGEILYARDGADGHSELVALERASGAITKIASADSAIADGQTIYVVSEAVPDQVGIAGPSEITWIAKLPGAKQAFAVTGAPGAPRLAVHVSDPESPPSICSVELADRSVRCHVTTHQQDGRPAMTRDGRHLYYAARAGIRRLDLVDGGDQVVVPGVRASGGLALSPDQHRLVFSDCRSYGSVVAVTDGGAPEVLVGRGMVIHPSGGPDGRLAWIAARDGVPGTRVMVRVGTGPERELVAVDGEIGRSAFDARGATIAYSIGGPGGGIRSVPVAGGAPTVWTSDPGDRVPTWTADGGVAFTRLSETGPSVMYVPRAGEPAQVVLAGWSLEDGDRARTLLVRKQRTLATFDLARRVSTPLRLGDAGQAGILGARLAPDGSLVVLGGEDQGTYYRVDRGGNARVVYRIPGSQTAGPPTLLSDGRIAFRPAIWIGELYGIDGDWAGSAHPR